MSFICSLEKLNVKKADPQNDIYLCREYNCKSFHKYQENHLSPLINAIYYLELQRVKDLLNQISKEEVIDKYNFYNLPHNNYNHNILYFIFSNFMNTGCAQSDNEGKLIPSLHSVSWYSLRKVIKPKNLAEKISNELTIELVEYLCSTYPELITYNDIEGANRLNCNVIANILENYYIDKIKTYDEPICCICFSSFEVNLINNVCVCKNHIHIKCLIKCINQFGDICRTCNNSTHSHLDSKNRIMFPKVNIYPSPLLTGYLILKDEFEQLHYAIAYLCIDRIKDLLNNMSDEKFKKYVEKADYYTLHKKENNLLKLKDVPYTNLSRSNHTYDFLLIEKMFEEKSTKKNVKIFYHTDDNKFYHTDGSNRSDRSDV